MVFSSGADPSSSAPQPSNGAFTQRPHSQPSGLHDASTSASSAVATGPGTGSSVPSERFPKFPVYRPPKAQASDDQNDYNTTTSHLSHHVSPPPPVSSMAPAYKVHGRKKSSSGSNPASSLSDSAFEDGNVPRKLFLHQPPAQGAQSAPVLPAEPLPPPKDFKKSPVGVSLDTAKDIQKQQELTSVKSNHIYSHEDFVVETYGYAGEVVQRMGIFAYVLFFAFPLLYVALFFAIIPLKDPNEPAIKYQWTFIFVSNTCIMLAIAYLYNAAFLALARCKRPFRTSVVPLVAVVVVQIAIATPPLLLNGVFKFFGIYALALCYITLFLSMLVAYWDMRQLVHSFFRRFMTLLILYIPLLGLFVIAYRHANAAHWQAILSFLFAFLTFVYRRLMLSRLDQFPLDESQLFSGFWVQNLGDCTQILALPQVQKPTVFLAIFAANSIANIALLVFVTDWWIYKIRPVLKTNVKNAFKCNFPIPHPPPADLSFDPVNRGHDNNVGGYRRRQFRFFFYRMLSQAVAMVMYLGISPMLKYGLNKEFTPLSSYDSELYFNSLIYAGANFGFIGAVTLFGYLYLRRRHPETFREIREIHRHDFVHHTMVGMVTAIITHNMILTIAIILSHYCIFNAFLGCNYEKFAELVSPEGT